MAKVFRFHEGSTLEDWQASTPYGSTAIAAIKDPSGASAKKEITSIPSPFARIDLVKTAFENITDCRQMDGKTIFHKMVSDCFDVGEIFFNIDKLEDKVSIIVWDKGKDLEALLQSPNHRHKMLGNTLKLYLEQDAQAYNFAETEQLYLLNYKAGPKTLNIIGGTSPASLFFTPANDLKYADIRFGNDVVFDNDYQPLYKRDFEYQKFIFGLKRFMPDFPRKFRVVNNYLESSFELLTAEQKNIITEYTKADFESDFERLTAGSAGTPVEILGYALRKKKETAPTSSGFIIAAVKETETALPLVLPVDAYAEKTLYTSDLWDRNNKVPYTDERPLNDRILPFDGKKYPYLTISDFLEPYIIRTIYPLYKDKFFDGGFSVASGEAGKGYLLPVKREYFDYFDVGSLQRTMLDGKKAIEIKQLVSGGVTVTLRVPIQNNKYITYERIYYNNVSDYQIAEPNLERNHGAIIENQFGLTVYPFFKLADDSQNHYRIALTDRDIQDYNKHNSYSLQFFKNQNNALVPYKAARQRSEKNHDNVASSYYVLEQGFDYIEIKNSWARGIIIPLFELKGQGTAEFTFAVDFGTTNTHIEYKKDNSDARPFEITDDIQIATLHDSANPVTIKSINAVRANKLIDLIPQELIPEKIGANNEFQFPLRTAILSNQNLDLDRETYALSDFNIPFVYEKYSIPKNSKTRTNLKWSDSENPHDVKVLEAFFENLLLLMRNKVLLNDGDINKTRLIWLYPSSMTKYRINQLETKWGELFKKYINTVHIPEKMSESVAPFYYFNSRLGVNALASSVVSVDIGGGTTDVVVYANNRPELLTSFKFAANAIFGDAYGRSSHLNGFIQKYADRIHSLLETNKQHDLVSILKDIKENGSSEDIVAFFFSIERNKKIQDNNIPISFTKKLTLNNDLKIVFVIFYAAIMYHIAKLMKAKQLTPPKHITFSGTGSKMVNLADPSLKLDALTTLTQLVFKEVYSEQVPDIKLNQDASPKEISCKGALNAAAGKDVQLEHIKAVLIGKSTGGIVPEVALTYNDVDVFTENSVAEEYHSFLDWFFSLNKTFSFKDNFGINPGNLESYRHYLKENTLDDLKSGIEKKKQELGRDVDVNLEETLFFYPLTGGLNNLAYKIHTELNTQST